MILTGQNSTVRSVNAFLYRTVPIWEGHTREALSDLVAASIKGRGDAVMIAQSFTRFIQAVGKGFSDSAFANRFMAEVRSGANKRCSGKPAHLQAMAKCLLESPDHIGLAKALSMLEALKGSDTSFAEVEIDMRREYREAIRLADFSSPDEGFEVITQRRSVTKLSMPSKYISTVHKAKGLEADHVLLLPCDKTHFGNSEEKRCLLYVALSRAKTSLTLVVSQSNPTPWITMPQHIRRPTWPV